MTSSAQAASASTPVHSSQGWLNGLIGVVIFSGSLPATRLAVLDLPPVWLTVARASMAGVLALAVLLWCRQQRPARSQMVSLAVVAVGVVLGFPLLTALALQHVPAAHSIVLVALLPLCTAVCGVWRGGERLRPAFWALSLLGAALVLGFALWAAWQQGGETSLVGDGLMLLAVAVCGLGYAEGAKLSRSLGGWQVISWALVLSLPVMLPLTLWLWPADLGAVRAPAWWGLAYVALFSMWLGFVFWYRGLAQGGIAAVGQLQLLQPLLGLALAAWLLGEAVSPAMLAVTVAVIACVAGAKRVA
ncbi:DMT family transporter [Comamonas terrigena]|uniref:DMT family transporter n=1 Tax=Comamonas terrigena TaxID=32013 RepID=UPI00244A5503|nr:DMT family transporter [Comamonas terrigena]MDH1702441.1 DMT family transporter [Comamonas terrigena]